MSTSAGRLRLAPSSILSIIGGSLMVISGVVSLVTLGIPGYYGMMGPGMMGPGMMMPFQSFMWTAIAVISAISIGIGVILIIGGYLIYRKSESAINWGVVILVLSIVGLFGMGGFFVGPILGIIGGILALTKR
ncbi:MAG TPA: hypothetical protein VFR94_12630 [Nitrososphaeraceae archaeon]|nr:hypothetical protein [Nitrososphaeraceae archaeon]